MYVKHLNSPVPVNGYLHFQFYWKVKTQNLPYNFFTVFFFSKELVLLTDLVA